MTENVSCLFSIDSDSRFSEKDCPRCAHLYDKSDDEDDPPCCEEWYTAPPGLGGADPLYSGLPHVKWGWNEFEAELREEVVYYKNKPVLTLEEIKRFDKGIHSWNQDKEDEEERKEKEARSELLKEIYREEEPYPCEEKTYADRYRKYDEQWYHFYLSYYGEDKPQVWGGKVLYFDNYPMTDAHVHLKILRKVFSE